MGSNPVQPWGILLFSVLPKLSEYHCSICTVILVSCSLINWVTVIGWICDLFVKKCTVPFERKFLPVFPTNGKRSSYSILFVEKLHCSIWQRIVTRFPCKWKALLTFSDFLVVNAIVQWTTIAFGKIGHLTVTCVVDSHEIYVKLPHTKRGLTLAYQGCHFQNFSIPFSGRRFIFFLIISPKKKP